MIESELRFGNESIDLGSKKFDFLPQEEREALIFPVFKAFLTDLVKNNTFYREWYVREGVDLESIETLSDITKLPLLTPRVVRSIDPLELLPDRYATHIRQEGTVEELGITDPIAQDFSSSGSTGRPKVTYYTEQDWALGPTLYKQAMADIPFEERNRLYCLFNPGHIGGPAYRDMVLAEGGTFVAKHFTITNPEDVIRDLMTNPRGPFNALAIPPRPPRQTRVAKGTTLYHLIEAEGRLGTNYLGENIRTIIVNGAPIRYPDDALDLVRIMHDKNEAAGVDFRTKFSDQGGSAETLYNFASHE
ncbi:hypothetical protein D6783_02670, partial [Candidatus Woesearchaeota archaeon]